ncbi:MAG: Hsp20/alpha crystallin family protein [Leptonema sp. (in: bacteria)]
METNIQSLEQQKEKRKNRIYTPAVDILENQDSYILFVEMPGCSEKDVDITVERNILKIYGKVQHQIPEGYRLFYSEYGIGDYERTFELSDEINQENIEATLKDGILKLVLPKVQPSVKKINVKIA